MKHKILLTFITILQATYPAYADDEQTIYFHLHPPVGLENAMVVNYVLCEPEFPNKKDVKCVNPTEKKYTIPADSNGSIKIPKKDGYAIIATSLEFKGKPIWGPYAAEYAKNICNTQRGNDSLSFFLNGKESYSVTCIPGMGK